jgi:hypothetical protein
MAIGTTLRLKLKNPVWKDTGATLRSVFIDTGENGTFSRAEFEAISTPGQMEYVTPEEIASSVVFEIKGGNTGHDIINALDNATLNPTYRAGFLFDNALNELKRLEEVHGTKSIAFEMLGPPRLSKLLYEAHLLSLAYGSMDNVLGASPQEMVVRCGSLIQNGAELRSAIISIGIPILMPNGKTLLRGPEIKIPAFQGEESLPVKRHSIDKWAHDGWIDLRLTNMKAWRSRFEVIRQECATIPRGDSSSQYLRTRAYWDDFESIDPGKLVGWIFSEEEQGKRMKA